MVEHEEEQELAEKLRNLEIGKEDKNESMLDVSTEQEREQEAEEDIVLG